MLPTPNSNTLFYGDNLEVLREHVAAESLDLVYLDPPFNSKRNYNILFKEASGEAPASQIKAFGDTWEYSQVSRRHLRSCFRSLFSSENIAICHLEQNFVILSEVKRSYRCAI